LIIDKLGTVNGFIIPSPKPKYEIHPVTPLSRVYTEMIRYSIFAWLP
jgi:hypothetical protein